MNQTEKELYDAEMRRIITNSYYKDKPIELFYQLIRTADTFGIMKDFCERAGLYRSSYKNWLYSGEMPQVRSFIRVLAVMGYDVKITKRR